MNIVRFCPEHLDLIDLQDAQGHMSAEIAQPGRAARLAQGGQAFTGIDGGEVVVIGGVLEQGRGRGVAWALLSRQAGRHMVAIHRAVRGYMLQSPLPRIEAFVDADFAAGVRWMTALGFVNETPTGPMRKYTPDGRDCYLFARIK